MPKSAKRVSSPASASHLSPASAAEFQTSAVFFVSAAITLTRRTHWTIYRRSPLLEMCSLPAKWEAFELCHFFNQIRSGSPPLVI